MSYKALKHTLPLFLAQIFGMCGLITVLFIGGIVGMQLTTSKTLVTVPIAIAIIGSALFAIPSALLMQKLGRKRGNLLAALTATGGAVLAAIAIHQHSFILFCCGTFLIGINSAFVQQYRFAVIEGLDASLTAQAVSFLLFGNIISAYLGTELASISRAWFNVPYVGSFVMLTLLLLLSLFSLSFFRELGLTEHPEKQKTQIISAKKPIIKKNLAPAIIIAASSYFMMSLIMVATPVSMHYMHHFAMPQTTLVMQSHLIAMYLPSLFVGFLAHKWGNLNMVWLGIGCFVVTVLINLLGVAFPNYLSSLILLGIGWNFSFIAATTLFTESYHLHERFKMQALNDFFVFGSNAIASLFSGTLIVIIGWLNLNLCGIIILIVMIISAVIIQKNNKKTEQQLTIYQQQ